MLIRPSTLRLGLRQASHSVHSGPPLYILVASTHDTISPSLDHHCLLLLINRGKQSPVFSSPSSASSQHQRSPGQQAPLLLKGQQQGSSQNRAPQSVLRVGRNGKGVLQRSPATTRGEGLQSPRLRCPEGERTPIPDREAWPKEMAKRGCREEAIRQGGEAPLQRKARHGGVPHPKRARL